MTIFQKVLLCLTIIGGINWGLIGLFNFNLVTFLFQEGSVVTRIIYVVIALASLGSIVTLFTCHTHHMEHIVHDHRNH